MSYLTFDWPSMFSVDIVSMFPLSYAPALLSLSHCLRLIHFFSCTRYCAFSVISAFVVLHALTHCFSQAFVYAHVIVFFSLAFVI